MLAGITVGIAVDGHGCFLASGKVAGLLNHGVTVTRTTQHMGLLNLVIPKCLAALAAPRIPGELVKRRVPGSTSAQLDQKIWDMYV